MLSKKLIGMHVLSAAFCIAPVAVAAQASPILPGSALSFTGQSKCTNTQCTLSNAMVTSGVGSYSSFTFGTSANFSPFVYAPFTPQQVYSTTNGLGQTASFFTNFELARSVVTVGGLTSYTFTDGGIASLTGYADTAGTYLFTANQEGAFEGSFSATSHALSSVPEPVTWAMMILGFGMIGAGLRYRRRSTEVRFA